MKRTILSSILTFIIFPILLIFPISLLGNDESIKIGSESTFYSHFGSPKVKEFKIIDRKNNKELQHKNGEFIFEDKEDSFTNQNSWILIDSNDGLNIESRDKNKNSGNINVFLKDDKRIALEFYSNGGYLSYSDSSNVEFVRNPYYFDLEFSTILVVNEVSEFYDYYNMPEGTLFALQDVGGTGERIITDNTRGGGCSGEMYFGKRPLSTFENHFSLLSLQDKILMTGHLCGRQIRAENSEIGGSIRMDSTNRQYMTIHIDTNNDRAAFQQNFDSAHQKYIGNYSDDAVQDGTYKNLRWTGEQRFFDIIFSFYDDQNYYEILGDTPTTTGSNFEVDAEINQTPELYYGITNQTETIADVDEFIKVEGIENGENIIVVEDLNSGEDYTFHLIDFSNSMSIDSALEQDFTTREIYLNVESFSYTSEFGVLEISFIADFDISSLDQIDLSYQIFDMNDPSSPVFPGEVFIYDLVKGLNSFELYNFPAGRYRIDFISYVDNVPINTTSFEIMNDLITFDVDETSITTTGATAIIPIEIFLRGNFQISELKFEISVNGSGFVETSFENIFGQPQDFFVVGLAPSQTNIVNFRITQRSDSSEVINENIFVTTGELDKPSFAFSSPIPAGPGSANVIVEADFKDVWYLADTDDHFVEYSFSTADYVGGFPEMWLPVKVGGNNWVPAAKEETQVLTFNSENSPIGQDIDVELNLRLNKGNGESYITDDTYSYNITMGTGGASATIVSKLLETEASKAFTSLDLKFGVDWNDHSQQTPLFYEYKETSSQIWTNKKSIPNSNPYTSDVINYEIEVIGLKPGTSYDFRIFTEPGTFTPLVYTVETYALPDGAISDIDSNLGQYVLIDIDVSGLDPDLSHTNTMFIHTNGFLPVDSPPTIDSDKTYSFKVNTEPSTTYFNPKLLLEFEVNGERTDLVVDLVDFTTELEQDVTNLSLEQNTFTSVKLNFDLKGKADLEKVRVYYIEDQLDETNGDNWNWEDLDLSSLVEGNNTFILNGLKEATKYNMFIDIEYGLLRTPLSSITTIG